MYDGNHRCRNIVVIFKNNTIQFNKVTLPLTSSDADWLASLTVNLDWSNACQSNLITPVTENQTNRSNRFAAHTTFNILHITEDIINK